MSPIRGLWLGTMVAVAGMTVASVPALAQLPSRPQTQTAAQSSGNPVIYLDQAWSPQDRAAYYWGSQGSALLSYDIYLALEVAGSQELFNSPANSDRVGLLV